MRKVFIYILFSLILFSCSTVNYNISSEYKSVSYNERIRFIILHYTALDDERSFRALTKNSVSAHYLVLQDKKKPILSLVPEFQRSWHAGISYFDGYKNLNDNSIGIEISNLGYVEVKAEELEHSLINIAKVNKIDSFDKYFLPNITTISSEKLSLTVNDKKQSLKPIKKEVPNIPLEPQSFQRFNDEQILKIGSLLKYLIEKYDIKPKYVLGHSDIAPTRKMDPGAKFPWRLLYEKFGVGAWYDEKDFDYFYNRKTFESLSVKEIKSEFRKYGYDMNYSNEWDWNSKKVVSAFQMHFRPERIDGVVDLETYAIIKALNKKYR